MLRIINHRGIAIVRFVWSAGYAILFLVITAGVVSCREKLLVVNVQHEKNDFSLYSFVTINFPRRWVEISNIRRSILIIFTSCGNKTNTINTQLRIVRTS